jgi:hypothetical protein
MAQEEEGAIVGFVFLLVGGLKAFYLKFPCPWSFLFVLDTEKRKNG